MGMKTLKESQIDGIKFYYRENTSDIKTFNEVIRNKTYFKKQMMVEQGENWVDCGGNVGAFTLLACKYGANVTVYEPDPFNLELLKKNLALNKFVATVKPFAVVGDDTKKANLYVGNNGNVWRNSLFKNWNGKGVQVDCVNFDKEFENIDTEKLCIKIDIEGAEMAILENTNKLFKKLVFEWSFDIDSSLPRFWDIIEKLEKNYNIGSLGNTARIKTRDYNSWQKSWFPACTNVFCFLKNK